MASSFVSASLSANRGESATRIPRLIITNLGRLTGAIEEGAHAHHMFPLKFEANCDRAGLKVNDPRYGAWWSALDHLRNAKGYHRRWEDFFRDNPDASPNVILAFGRQLAKDHGLTIDF